MSFGFNFCVKNHSYRGMCIKLPYVGLVLLIVNIYRKATAKAQNPTISSHLSKYITNDLDLQGIQF